MKIRSYLVLALSLAAAGCAPAPFDAGTDCPKETYCGQCASRGGCAWCGDPDKGQCLAIGHAECAAPEAWSKTPDHCPAPPADAGAPAATASAGASPSPMKAAIGEEKYESIRRSLQKAFPNAKVDDQVVDAVAAVLTHDGSRFAPPSGKINADGSKSADGPKSATGLEKAPVTKHVEEKEHPLYMGHADHHRVKSVPATAKAMQSEFTMLLPLVRVPLPDSLDADHHIIATVIGDVDLSRDHLLGSIDMVAGKYAGADYLGYRPEKIDLITPARLAGTRFGAIAVYIGYRKKADRGPSFYLLEAGTATGDAKMIYFSPGMKPITSVTSYYLPTPFVSMTNTYTGQLTMRDAPDESEPKQLYIESRAPGDKDPYITVTVSYQRVKEMDVAVPAEIIVDAASRVSLIAETMGIPNAEQLEKQLAEIARSFGWQQYPHYTTPEAAATAAPTAAPAAAPRTP